jgi:monoamine oxidase
MPDPPEPTPDAVKPDGTLTRRGLVGAGALAAGAAAAPGAADAATRRRRTPRKRRLTADVVVIGGGFSGLAAARRLVAARKRVVLLESRGRAGGRSMNVRTPDGTVVDIGATFVGPTQTKIIEYANAMGVGRFPTYNTGANVYMRGGNRATYTGAIPPESLLSLANLQYSLNQVERLAATVPVDAPWRTPNAVTLDAQTVTSWLDQNAADEGARRLGRIAIPAIMSAEAHDVSMLYFLFYIASAGGITPLISTAGGAQEQRADGGTQLIARRIAARLGRRVVYRSPVRRIDQTSRRAVVVDSDRAIVRARRVILTVPLNLQSRIEYRPLLPGLRDQLLQNQPMGSVAKAVCVYDEPFWRRDGLTGQTVSDGFPCKVTFDISPRSGRPGVMMGFLDAQDARVFNASRPAERRRLILENFASFFGPRARNPVSYMDFSWDDEQWTRGGPICHFPPGKIVGFMRTIREPQGRLHFAGTETATRWAGYMDGAIRSGERAANEVLERL